MNRRADSPLLPHLTVRRGKVRDIYDLGDKLLLVTSDSISAFDWVQKSLIPDKGRILDALSNFWFERLRETNHVVTADFDRVLGFLPPECQSSFDRSYYAGRSTIVRKTRVAPVECVVRGFLEGSGWKEYRQTGTVCGLRLALGLQQCSALPEVIFTPATKEASGHDQNISFERMCEIVGTETAEELRARSIAIYRAGAQYALDHGIIIADTKFEWGWDDDKLILIDEVLTPDSSRFWPVQHYQPGRAQVSFDKQFLREWLEQSGWDKNSPPPELSADIIAKTREKYIQAYEGLTDTTFQWK